VIGQTNARSGQLSQACCFMCHAFGMNLGIVMGGLLSVVVVGCDSSECRPAGAPNPTSDIWLMSSCGIESVTTNCAARRTLSAQEVMFSPVVTETCNVKLLLADGEIITGTLSFRPGNSTCGPLWDSEWNGQFGAVANVGSVCRPDAGNDAGLGGD
jgi:hypothetical protein